MTSRNKRAGTHRLQTRTIWQWTILALIAGVVLGGLYIISHPPGHVAGQMDAVVIDQLTPDHVNEALRVSVRASLEKRGFRVVEYEGDEVDVGLYRGLGSAGCRILFIRSHAGLLVSEDNEDEHTTALFTNETYSRFKYVEEQMRDRVLIVHPFESDCELTFGISPHFVVHSMDGDLPSTLVIIAGCSCLEETDLAKAFFGRGASAVISWSDSVDLDYLDAATEGLVNGLLNDGLTIAAAVEATMAEFGPDPESGARLMYFPLAAGRHTVDDLIR